MPLLNSNIAGYNFNPGAPSTYRTVYGGPDPKSSGPLKPYLADPSKYKSQFLDGGYKWVIVPDAYGNPWFLLVGGRTDDELLYDWPEIAKHNLGGSQAAEAAWNEVNSAILSANGLKENHLIRMAPSDPTMRIWGFPPTATVFHRTESGPIDVNQLVGQNLGGSKDIGTDLLGQNLGPASQYSAVDDISYAEGLILKIPRKDGPPLEVICQGNLWTRTAYVIGFPGVRTAGDPVAEIVRTFIDLVKIVIGVYSGNVGMAVEGAADIVVTWYSYSEAIAAAAAAANAKGKALSGSGTQGTGNTSSGGALLRGRASMTGTNRTVGDVAKQRKDARGTGLLIAAAVGAWLVLS